jgi:dTDP-4-dehydrorhamnose 3,5-epimerase
LDLKTHLIDGLIVENIKIIHDEKGSVLHMLRSDSALFKNFGEIYFSEVKPNIIKGWKIHHLTTQRFAVPSGSIKLVIFDDRENSSTKGLITEISFGRDNYKLVIIPPNLWYSFKGISKVTALIANCIDFPHDPSESETIDIDNKKIPYVWS